jgi:hypothetical protein
VGLLEVQERVARAVSGGDLVDDRPRPPRMKKPKVTPAAHRVYKEYTQDLLRDMLVEKYGTVRGVANWEYFIGKGGAFYAVGQEIQDEKAQMFLDLGEQPPHDYWAQSYFDVWKRWMARPASRQASEGTMDRTADAYGKMTRAYQQGIEQFKRVRGNLFDIVQLWHGHWSYGNTPDPVLDDMQSMSSKMAGQARAMKDDVDAKIEEWEDAVRARGKGVTGGVQSGGKTMDRKVIAREILEVAKMLTADWTPVRQDVNVSMRNKEMHDSLTSYAPKISSEMRKAAAMSLAKQGFQVDSRGVVLTKEWSEYLAFVAPDINSNKYHYYSVFSFEPEPGSKRFVAYNCSGRIGIIEREYDLTLKFYRGAVDTLQKAMQAVNAHLRTKLAKGYEEVPMIRG